MYTTKASPTRSNPRVTDKVWVPTPKIANYAPVDIPMRSPPAILPGQRTSTPRVRIRLLPPLFLSSYHVPENSTSKSEISSFQDSCTTFIVPVSFLWLYSSGKRSIPPASARQGLYSSGKRSSRALFLWQALGKGPSPLRAHPSKGGIPGPIAAVFCTKIH